MRNSGLPPDETKKFIVDTGGNLKYSRVLEALRLLGSKFVHEVQSGNRQPQRQKTHEVNYVQDDNDDVAFNITDDASTWESGDVASTNGWQRVMRRL